ncbi:MAG: alpha-glucan family phosphorylase [Rhodocyclaceae bacterium]|nr:alpha-glucan family phosphorylase [Rhodocyclaceae bacterium]MBX3667840.1 alpha-glucan family phosphorylase [Rhodocyclaceae bacterium]
MPAIFPLDVRPVLPPQLARLEELANDLWYSWDRDTRSLFSRLHVNLWEAVGHSPKALLKRVAQRRLDAAAQDPVFLHQYAQVLVAYDAYRAQSARTAVAQRLHEHDLIAYFCAEFGLHESLPIYSGGLGILAGDHCKAASDYRLPLVGIGLLYRQGYFSQTIDKHGNQQAAYADSDFDDLPVAPVLDPDGKPLVIQLDLARRRVGVQLWQARVGHVRLVLLDTDIDSNSPQDRDIAHRLYGGDKSTRIEQEILLGMGGVRALAALGLHPTVWHINEGHAAFMIVARLLQRVEGGLDFDAALEAVAANTVFTTHTAVPAGHDHFTLDMLRDYLGPRCVAAQVPFERVAALGLTPASAEFNMTALALRGSRFQNGVSRIHGLVSARICAAQWPQVSAEENPIAHITNGVHIPSFLSAEWREPFNRYLAAGWSGNCTDPAVWRGVHDIPDHQFWSVRQSLKVQMLHLVRYVVARAHARNLGSESHLGRLLRLADATNPNVLTIGFARRFATYKRALLLFDDVDWLRQILCDEARPVLLLFAGKAHPADQPAQETIRRLAEYARMPEFEGRVLLLENYDLRLARRLLAGVDVWLNNPIYPLEASGTSGMKAALNGVINLSVLDGWWGEAYDGSNGWAIKPVFEGLDEASRARDEARTLYEILQDEVIPLYYARGSQGYSPGWIALAKRSIERIAPHFNAARMVGEYVAKFYQPAASQGRRHAQDDYALARELAAWKARVAEAWPRVQLRSVADAPQRLSFGNATRYALAVQLAGLDPASLRVEAVFSRPGEAAHAPRSKRLTLQPVEPLGKGEHLYALEFTPDWCGRMECRFRAYPAHAALTHAMETGLMCWL